MGVLLMLGEAAILASALSLDAFVASFAYGSNKIKIPILSVQIINLICSSILGLSLLIGSILKQFIPEQITIIISFSILFLLGVIKLFDSLTKSIIRKYNSLNKEIHFNMFNFKCVLSLYADPEMADQDHSKTISSGEAASLALALSLDGIAVGFGAALGTVNPVAVFACSWVTDAMAVILGGFIGNRVAQKLPFNLSWISGIILMLMAFAKFF